MGKEKKRIALFQVPIATNRLALIESPSPTSIHNLKELVKSSRGNYPSIADRIVRSRRLASVVADGSVFPATQQR